MVIPRQVPRQGGLTHRGLRGCRDERPTPAGPAPLITNPLNSRESPLWSADGARSESPIRQHTKGLAHA